MSEGLRPIAAEVSQLFPLGTDQRAQGARQRIADMLMKELHSAGVGGLYIETPHPGREHMNREWFRETARQFRHAIVAEPNSESYVANGVSARRIAGQEDPIIFGQNWISNHQPIEAAGYPLARVLHDKNEQIATPYHDGYLIAVKRGMPTNVEDIIASCAFIDFSPAPNVARVYIHVSDDNFALVYDREAYEAMASGNLPTDPDARDLVVRWIEARMGAHWESGLDLALRISWDQGGVDWLSTAGVQLLELEAHLLLQQSEWNTPRELWELLRGTMPIIGDGRRRVRPIVV